MKTYRALLRTPRMVRLYAAMLIARSPIGINGVATILFLRNEGESYAVAGAAAGGLALGSAIGAPITARLVDRLSTRVLPWLAVGHAAGLLAVVTLGLLHVPSPLLLPVTVLAGSTLPAISSVIRASYGAVLARQPALIPSAFALEAVLTNAIFFFGPLATAVLTWQFSAAVALMLSAVAVVSGTVWFVSALPPELAGRRVDDDGNRHWAGALRSRGLQTLVVSMVPVGFAYGVIEVVLLAFSDEEGNRNLTGVLFGVWSLGSALGGMIYGSFPRRLPLRTMHFLAAAALPVVIAALALARSPFEMGVLIALTGLPSVPLLATRNELAGLVALPGAETESYTWPFTAFIAGSSIGAAVAGMLADGAGWRAAVLTAVVAATLGALAAVIGRATLAPTASSAPALT